MPKKAAPKTGSTLTKSDLIRSMPTSPAAAIIAKAKTHGMKLTANHVYAVRAIDKRRSADKKAKSSKTTPISAAPAAGATATKSPGRRPGRQKRGASNGNGNHEANFMAMVLDMGLAKAESLLHRVRERVRDL